jgi:hypothetical protein
MLNFEQIPADSDGTIDNSGATSGGGMTSIIPFIGNAVFELADIKVMSHAYSKAIENIHGFGHPNRVVGEMIATTIITLTQGGERDPDRLCKRALAACGFGLDRVG